MSVCFLKSLNHQLPCSDVFGPWELLDTLKKENQELGLIIDLTFTTRYYSLQVNTRKHTPSCLNGVCFQIYRILKNIYTVCMCVCVCVYVCRTFLSRFCLWRSSQPVMRFQVTTQSWASNAPCEGFYETTQITVRDALKLLMSEPSFKASTRWLCSFSCKYFMCQSYYSNCWLVMSAFTQKMNVTLQKIDACILG